jgi:hypothetical protein
MRRALIVGLVLVLVLLLVALAAACGSSTGGGASSSAGSTRSFTAFTSCLKQHGVKPLAGFGGGQPPSGSPPNGGSRPQPSAARQKALAACRQYAPQGGQGGFGSPSG